MPEFASAPPSPWSVQHGRRDERRRHGTNGDPAGSNGVRGLKTAYAVIAGLILAVDSVNVLTLLDDAKRHGERLATGNPSPGNIAAASRHSPSAGSSI